MQENEKQAAITINVTVTLVDRAMHVPVDL